MSPTSKSKAWASMSRSARWYQWSAGPSWWHNIDLRSWMMIEPRYWPTFSPLHQDITPSCRSRRHHQLDRLWLIADSSLSSGIVVNLGWPNHDVDLLDNNDYDIGSPSFIECYEISKRDKHGGSSSIIFVLFESYRAVGPGAFYQGPNLSSSSKRALPIPSCTVWRHYAFNVSRWRRRRVQLQRNQSTV